MNNTIELKDFFMQIPNYWFFISAVVLTLLIRSILTIFKALAINNGEVDDTKNRRKWRSRGFSNAFKHSFWSNGKDIRIDDYWLPAIIGCAELIVFSLFMAKGWVVGIGAWIAIKTATSWGGWQKTRTAYNRFLLGNILSLSAAYLIYKVFGLGYLGPV